MPSPTLNDLHVDTLLTNISIAYRNPAYVADLMFPMVQVSKQSNKYPVYTKADWFRNEATRRAPGEEAKRSGYNVDSSNTFYCDNFAHGTDITDEQRAGADDVYKMNLDRAGSEYVTDKLQLQREVQWMANFFVTGVWGTSTTPGNLWDVYASSTPIQDIHDGVETILTNTGKIANTLLLGYNVWNELQDHPNFLDRIKHTERGVLTEELLARIVGVERVVVARAIYTTNLELNTDETYQFVAGKHALLAYVPPRPSLLEPSAGYTFVWDGGFGGAGPQILQRRRDGARHTDVIEGFSWYDQKITAADCGYMWVSIVS